MSDLSSRLDALGTTGPLGLKPAEVLALAREIGRDGDACGLQPLRLGVLCSYSFQFAEPYLVVEAARRGLLLRCHVGPFGQFEQALAERGGELERFGSNVLLLAMRPEDVDPDAVVRFHASGGRRFADLAATLRARLCDCVRLFRAFSDAPVLVANFAAPASPPLRVFDANVGESLTYALADANRALRDALAGQPDTLVWDYAGLVREAGAADWTDRRLAALARTPVAARHQPRLAAHLVRTLRALVRPPAKCLVLDLDNTLWGGVIGDDGIEGIQLGDDHPGVAYKSVQRAALALRDRGVLLAVVSKNDPEPAEAALRDHPEMLIRPEHLAAVRINWEPKSRNLRALAEELNLSADALVLFDDNPVERAEVRANAPEVRVIEVPPAPLLYEQALADCADFDTVTLTEEDAVRADLYRQEGQRRQHAERASSLEDFLRELDMQATVGRLDAPVLQRVAQLVAKTNQFNLTTRRRGRAELQALADDPDHVVAWLRLADRYGDAGLVAVGVLRREGETAVIDTLLMSCRVMGRRVEHAFVAYLAEQARALGCSQLVGEFLPSAKNAVVRDLYPQLGFEPDAEAPDGGRRHRVPVDAAPAWPDWIARRDAPDAGAPETR